MSESEQSELDDVQVDESAENEPDTSEADENQDVQEATQPVSEQTGVQATITGSVTDIKRILNETSIGFHDNPYMEIADGTVRFIAGNPGNSVVVYTDYVEGAVDSIEGETEAVITVSRILDTLKLIGDTNSEVTLEFEGVEDSQLAQRLKIEGELESGIVLPGSESVLNRVPMNLPDMFTEDDRLLNGNTGDPAGTHIETFINSLDKIVEVSDVREDLSHFPIVVKDGQFRLDVGDRNQDYIAGALPGTVVEGDDLSNVYGDGFKFIVKELSGDVDLYVEQDAPVCIVKERSHGTIRHVVGPASGD